MIGIIEPEAVVVEQGAQLSAAEIQAHFTEKRKLQMVSEAKQQLAERKITLSELIKQAEDERDKEKWVLGEILGKDELVQLFEGVSDFQILRKRINDGDQQALYTLQERVNTLSPEIPKLLQNSEDMPLTVSQQILIADVVTDEGQIEDVGQYFQRIRSLSVQLGSAWSELEEEGPYDFQRVNYFTQELINSLENFHEIEQFFDELAQRVNLGVVKKFFSAFIPDVKISEYLRIVAQLQQTALLSQQLYYDMLIANAFDTQKSSDRKDILSQLQKVSEIPLHNPNGLVQQMRRVKSVRLQQSPGQARDFSTLARLADQMNVVIRANERIARAQTKLENNSDKAERAMPHVSSIQELDDQIVEQLVRHLRANPTQESEALDQFIQGLIDQQVNFVEGVQAPPSEAIKTTPETEDPTQEFQRLMGRK